MTHQDVLDRDVVDRYVSDRLPAAERASFEEHFFECDACFAEVQATEHLRLGVRHLARTGEIDEGAAPVAGFPEKRRAGSRLAPWLAAAAALMLAVALVWLAQARVTELRTRLEDSERRASTLEQQLAQARVPQAADPAPAPLPQPNVPVALLQATRAGADGVPLTIPPGAQQFVLWIDEVPAALTGTAEIVLASEDGRVVQRVGGLRPNPYGAIVASLPAAAVLPGNYVVRVIAAGGTRPLGEYRLVIRRP